MTSREQKLAEALEALTEKLYEVDGRCPLCLSGRGLPSPHASWCRSLLAREVLAEPEEPPCGGTRCFRAEDGTWVHSSKSYGTCSEKQDGGRAPPSAREVARDSGTD